MNPFSIFGLEPVLEKLLDSKCRTAIRAKYRDFVAREALRKSVSLETTDNTLPEDSPCPFIDIRTAATILLDAKLAKKWIGGDVGLIEKIRRSFEKDEKDDPRRRKVSEKFIEMSSQSHNVKILSSELAFFPDLSLNEIDIRICWVQGNMIQRFFKKDCTSIPNIVSLRLYSNMLHQVSKHVSKLVRLQSLWLHDNFLSYVPDELCGITSLTELQLHKNPLIVLMPRIYLLTRLQKLTWDHKYVGNVFPEVVGQGSASVMKYLKLLAENRQSEGYLCLENLGLVNLPEWTKDTLPKYLIKCTENATFRWNNLVDVSTLSIALMLRSICLSYNKLSTFPKGLESLRSLQVIDLSYNQIRTIDVVVLQMTELQVLDLRNNFISEILELISQLTALKRVDLQQNMITQLPSWWSENWLANVVEVSWNHIKEPDIMSMGRSQIEINEVLKKIYRSHLSKSLCISGMSWEKVEPMFLFQGLVSLDCSNNIIATWPESLVVCTNLRSLCMKRNNLAIVPDGLALLSNLTYLDLSWNYIEKISKKLASCVRLEIVTFAKNAIQKLPSQICHIGSSLRDLNISGSGLMELPASLGHLCALVHLDASRNSISVLPQGVCLLSNLQVLNLSFNFLKILPNDIGSLIHLIILNLSKNVLTEVPSTISGCSRLRSLFLDRNQLSRLPVQIGKMHRLIHLDVSENRALQRYGSICSYPIQPKISIWKLKQGMQVFMFADETKRLRLEHTGLSLLPVEMLDLAAMTDVSLRGMSCTETLDLLSTWSTLTRLDLRDTNILEAPVYLGKFKGLKELFLDVHNPDKSSDPYIVQKVLRSHVSIAKLVEANEPHDSLNVAPSLLAFHDIAEKAELSGILQLKGMNLAAFPEFFFEMGKSLSEIDLSRNNIHEIPNAALGLVVLKTLRLNNNKLTTIPSSFAACIALTMVNVSHNELEHIPFAIIGMVELRHLFLQNNRISFLDGPFEGCTKLISLNASQNRISDISSKLSFCKLLQNIDLSFNNLDYMVFVGLYALQSVSLSNNHIRTIERSYLSCTALRRLDISNNHLDDVAVLLSSRSIRQLVITNNLINTIPDEVQCASSLVELHASSNRIKSVSSLLFLCPRITVVDFKNNAITYFAARAEQSETLSFLDISGNKGIQLCPSLGFLRQEVEFVFEIQDWDWPDPSNLSESSWNAVSLYLQKCYFALKDDALDLRGMNLSGNLKLIPLDRNGMKVPAHMFDKLNCKLLSLERNILSCIPEDTYELHNLLELNISNQAIEELSPSVFLMPHLKCLNARQTAIIEIPRNVSMCTTLKYLLLGCNNIRTIPEKLLAAPALEVLDIARCPIAKMPLVQICTSLKILVLNQDEFDDFFKDSLEKNAFSMAAIALRMKSLDEMNVVIRRTKSFTTFLTRKFNVYATPNKNSSLAIYFDCCEYKVCPDYLTLMLDCRMIKTISLSFNDFSASFESLIHCPWDNVCDLTLVDCNLDQLPSKSGNMWSSMTKLSLARNRIRVFPPQLLLLQKLVEVDLSDNPLLYIPITVGSLETLKKLHPQNCPLIGNSPILPHARAETVVGFLQNLWSFCKSGIFDMSSQTLDDVPKELRSKAFSSLMELRLQNNSITSWNSCHLSHLTAIKYFDISVNRLSDIDICCMQKAQYVNVSFNSLNAIPKGVEFMIALVVLNLSGNVISKVPDRLSLCSSLTHLKLSRNCISLISNQMTRLKKLETIELDGNYLSAVPKFCASNRLRVLAIDDNPITELPVWLCKSRSMKFLSFRNAKVDVIPCEMGYALQLETLMYDGNPLESPPIEVRRSGPFMSMKFLEMIGNSLHTGKLNLKELLLSELPAELEMFDHECKTPWCLRLKQAVSGTITFDASTLKTFDISHNKISNLERGHLYLFSSLVIMNLEHNNIRKLPGFFENLSCLISLCLRHNALVSLYPVIPACTTIEQLDASFNSLRKIDPSIRQMQHLVSFILLKNPLLEIPVEIGCLKALKTFTVDQLALDNSVPSTVAGQGTAALVIFLSRILKSQETASLEITHGDLFSVPRLVSQLQGTIKVDLSFNNLSVEALSDFLFILEDLEKRRQIELSKKSADEILQSKIQQTLFAGKNNVKSGFAAVPMLLSLQTLILSYNRLDKFPLLVSKIKNLTCLDVRNNPIQVLPEGIRELTKLLTLKLSHTHLTYPPVHVAFSSESNIQSETVDLENFSKFITATYPDDNKLVLKVIAFGLKFIPDTWILGVPFSEVQSMNLSDNIFDMQHQNDSIFFDSMLALKSLDLSGNRINHIPAVFSVLSKLNFLNMAKNYITEMSKTLLALNGLESLSMDDNIISVIPDGITSLTRLRFLSLKGNPFTDLPPLMCQLGEVLETLLVDDRLNFPAKEIVWEGTRAIISELTKVHHNMMSTSQMLFKQGYYRVPQMLAEYTRVTQLDLSKNSIQSVPEFFCRLVHLETLDFSKNRLVHIGKWVVSTSVLHHLDVSYNNLGVLSASLGVSKSLKYINASFNKITKISRSILGSPSLLTLDIVGNIGPIMWLHFQGLQKRIYTAKQKGKLWPAVEEVQADRLSHPSSMAFATYVWCSSQPHWSIKNTSGEVIYKEIPFDFILDALNDGLITEHFEIMCMNKASEKQTFRTYKKISFSIVFCEATRVWREKRKKQYEIDSDTWFLPNKLNSIMAQSCRFAGDSLPRSLVRSRDMSILDMSDCCLSTIPQCVGFLTGLRLLKLMRNNIVALPEELGYCTNLESIDLSQNNINALPDMFSRLSKLIIFTINENQLGVFPNSFSSLKSLSTLSFVRNSVICIDALNGLQNLTNLDGGCNALESIGSLCLCTTLENLRLPENKIKCLADGIQSMTRLQILNLRKNVLESLPTTLVFLTKLKNLDMRDNPVLASLLPPAMFNCYVNGPILRKYLKTVEAFDSITSLDLTFLDYTEIPKFVISWTTRRQKARSRWFWAISKVNSIIRRSFVSTLKMSKVESKANEDREASAAKIVGIKLSDTNVSVEQKAFDSNQLDRHLDDYYGRDHDSGHLRTRRIPWHLQKHFNREQLQSEHPEVFSVINSDSLSDVEKFEKIVTNMLLENPFFKSMIEYSWFYSNQQLPDGGKMTTQGPLRIHGILMLWLRDVIDMNSYVWADIVDENDAVLLYEWTKLSELPFFAQFLLLSTTCIDILTSLKLVPDVDILNQISICLLKHHKSLIKKRAYRDAYAAAIDMGVSDIQIVLMKDDEVIKAYGRITQLSESIEEDWEAVVGLEEKTAFLRNDDSAVVAYSRFQEEFFLLRVLIATDDFTPLPKYRQFSFVQESTRLFLSGNKLSRVSPLLSCLYILVELNFSGNEIMDLPITMKKLLQLQHLQLSRNRFQFLPEVLEYLGPNLVTLTLAWNSIKVIPDMIRSFSRIQELNFSYNRIATASNLINLSTLTALHLAGNNLARIFAIASMSSLTTLTLNDNPINYFPATFGNFNNNLKVISIDSWTRTGLPPCFLKNATFWLFTSPSSDETFDRPL